MPAICFARASAATVCGSPGRRRNAGLEGADGIKRPAPRQIHGAQVVIRVRRCGIELDRLFQRLMGLLELA
jgi:hypothetical protein